MALVISGGVVAGTTGTALAAGAALEAGTGAGVVVAGTVAGTTATATIGTFAMIGLTTVITGGLALVGGTELSQITPVHTSEILGDNLQSDYLTDFDL